MVTGTNTNFPAYSSQLKQLLSMSQLQLNNLAFASDAGKIFGFFSGIAAFYLPLWLVLLIGSALGLIGYGVQSLFLTTSICWINTVCYVVAIRNFPFHRQLALGLSTSYQGLSAKIYTVLVDALFFSFPDKRAKAYLILNSILPFLVSVLAAPVVRDVVDIGNSKNMKSGFTVLFIITIVTGIFAVITSLKSMASGLPPLGIAIGVVGFLLAPLVIPLAVKIREVLAAKWMLNREAKVRTYTAEENDDAERMESGVTEGDDTREAIEVGVKEEIGVKLLLTRLNFWLYFFVYLCGATLGLVYLNNLGQIAESRGYSGTSSLVSLSSSFGFFGRLIPSLVDYFFPRRKHLISRPTSIAALMTPMAGASLHQHCYYWYLFSVSTTTGLFGTKNFSINHNLVVANIPIGSFIFGYLSALLYHKEGNEDGKCMGMQCYRTTFIIWVHFVFLALPCL
uniref:Uncharacterized protein n=1 Tax=Manihot esculenta TaxID=3983 RepID=A0A2C9VU26_MANES